MKANEYIKNFGMANAKRLLHDARGCTDVKLWGEYEFSTDDLKRLVESHELIEKLGGLDGAKIYVLDGYKSERLKQAIANVESCQ